MNQNHEFYIICASKLKNYLLIKTLYFTCCASNYFFYIYRHRLSTENDGFQLSMIGIYATFIKILVFFFFLIGFAQVKYPMGIP